MPKVTSPHFDPVGLLTEVHKQDLGLHISTNNPAGFKRLMYNVMRAAPHLRCRIFSSPLSKQRFTLLKPGTNLSSPLEETPNAES